PSAVALLVTSLAVADADLDGLALALLRLVADARWQLAYRADDHHVADGYCHRPVDDPARRHLRAAHAARVADRARLLVPAGHVQVLDDHRAVPRARVEDVPLLA